MSGEVRGGLVDGQVSALHNIAARLAEGQQQASAAVAAAAVPVTPQPPAPHRLHLPPPPAPNEQGAHQPHYPPQHPAALPHQHSTGEPRPAGAHTVPGALPALPSAAHGHQNAPSLPGRAGTARRVCALCAKKQAS